MAMSRTQQLFTRFVPRSWAAAMEAESRTWMVRCPHCGFERSVWDMGGIRWKGAQLGGIRLKTPGNTWLWARCPHCGQRGWQKVYRQ